jgi:hypothetical protein
MLENLGLSVAALFILGGGTLLFDITPARDSSAIFRMLGGAVALAAGLITAALVLRIKFHWWRIQKQNRQRT